MEEYRGERPNVFSFVDAQRRRDAAALEEMKRHMDPDLIDFSKLTPERARRTQLDALALQALRMLSHDPRCAPEEIGKAVAVSADDPEKALEGTTHAAWLKDPAHYYVLADRYLAPIDAAALEIAEKNLRSGYPRIGGAAEPDYYRQAPSEYLMQILRDPGHLGIHGRPLEDVAFEYRSRRMNGKL